MLDLKFCQGISIVEMYHQLNSAKLDAQSMINWTVTSQLVGHTSTTVVYHRDHQALSTARFHHAGQLVTANTCTILLFDDFFLQIFVSLALYMHQ